MLTTLKASVIVFLGSVFLVVLSGCAVATKQIPIREIDRPVNMPAGIKQVDVNCYSGDSRNWSIRPNVSYSVTDKISFPFFPLPVIQYQFYGPQNDNCVMKVNDLSMAIIAGVGQYGGIWQSWNFASPQLGLIGKKILSKNLWLSISTGVNGEKYDIFTYVSGSQESTVGLQLNNAHSLYAGYTLWSQYYTRYDAAHDTLYHLSGRKWLDFSIPFGWNVHVTNFISTNLEFKPFYTYADFKTESKGISTSLKISVLW
jgi:hypothetical protein